MYLTKETLDLVDQCNINHNDISHLSRVPIQSELQTYLRNEYNAHIMIEPIDICGELGEDEEPIYVFGADIFFMLFTDEDINNNQDTIEYATYEECLEDALQGILKAIINHKAKQNDNS